MCTSAYASTGIFVLSCRLSLIVRGGVSPSQRGGASRRRGLTRLLERVLHEVSILLAKPDLLVVRLPEQSYDQHRYCHRHHDAEQHPEYRERHAEYRRVSPNHTDFRCAVCDVRLIAYECNAMYGLFIKLK